MPFQPGNQFSVGHGRPKGSSKPAFVRKWAEEKGLQRLIDLAEGKGHSFRQYNGRLVEVGPTYSVQVEALKLALAYGIGKPSEIEPPSRDPEESRMRVDKMLELLNKLESRPIAETVNGNGNGSNA